MMFWCCRRIKWIVSAIVLGLIFTCALSVSAADTSGQEWVVSKKQEITGYDLSGYTADPAVSFIFEDQSFKLDTAPLRRGDDVWVLPEEIAQKLRLVFIPVNDSAITVIGFDGALIDLKVGEPSATINKSTPAPVNKPLSKKDGRFMISVDTLAGLLGISSQYHADRNEIVLSRTTEEAFSSFTVEKPPEVIVEQKEFEKKEESLKPLELPKDIKEEALPAQFRKDIDLHVDTQFDYLKDMYVFDRLQRTRFNRYFLSGNAYDVGVNGNLSYKDFSTSEKSQYMNDRQFVSFMKDGSGIKLLDNYFVLPSLRTQSQGYWGIEADDASGTVFRKNIVRIGELDPVSLNFLDGTGTSKYFGKLVSVENEWHRTDKLKLTTTTLFVKNSPEFADQSGRTAYPRNNVVGLIDSDYLIYPGLNLYNTYGQSLYNRDDKPETTVSDLDYRTGFRFNQERFTFGSSVEYVGNQYVSLNIPDTYQDYLGGDFWSQFLISNYWTLSLSSNLNKNNVDHLAAEQTTFGKAFSIANSFSLPWSQNINVSWDYNSTLSRGAELDTNGNEYNYYSFDYYKAIGTMGLQAGYQYFRADPLGMSTGSNYFHLVSGSVYKFFPNLNGSYLRLYQDIRKNKQLSTGNTPSLITYDTDLTVRYYIRRNLNVMAECRLRSTEQDIVKNTAIVTLNTGIEYSPWPDTTVGFSYILNSMDLFIKNRTTRDYSLLFTARHMFDIQTPDKWGTVTVYVFEDKNNNGRLDADEGMNDVLAYVVDGRYAKTNGIGKAVIRKVVPGLRHVQIDMRGLPVELMVKGTPVQDVMVEPLKTSVVSFVMVRTGAVKGRVFIDMNKNGIYDKDIDQVVPNARVALLPTDAETFSFSDGTYVFEYVDPGEYDVTINTNTLPKDRSLISPKTVHVSLGKNEKKEDVNFLLEEKNIEVQYF